MFERILKYRRDLHQIPELDFDLPKTTAYVRSVLEKLPCEVFSPDGHAVCAWFDAGAHEAVAFRSDMDALPICEVSGVPFSSDIKGTCTPADMSATWPWCLSLRSMLRRSKTA